MAINLQEIGFNVISSAGEARSIILKTLDDLKDKTITLSQGNKNLDKAAKLINEAAKKHMDVVTSEAQGEKMDFSALFMHSEDIFLTTQTLLEITKRIIHLI